jgi:hypothetical protein
VVRINDFIKFGKKCDTDAQNLIINNLKDMVEEE